MVKQMPLQHSQCRNCFWLRECAYYSRIYNKCEWHITKKQLLKQVSVKRTAVLANDVRWKKVFALEYAVWYNAFIDWNITWFFSGERLMERMSFIPLLIPSIFHQSENNLVKRGELYEIKKLPANINKTKFN